MCPERIFASRQSPSQAQGAASLEFLPTFSAPHLAEAVQRPTMHFVTIKTPEQMDLLALHRVRSRLVGRRTGVINQIRGFLIERGITVRQGPMPLRKALSEILSVVRPANLNAD